MKTRIALWLTAALLTAVFLSLGRWQLSRGEQKQQMLDSVASTLQVKSAQSLAVAAKSAEGYTWASGHGRFLPAPVLLLDSQRRGDRVGVLVFGVFQPDGARPLLVELGWLPLPGDRQLPDIQLPSEALTVTGLLMPPPSTGIALGPAYLQSGPGQWLLTRVDLAALADALRLPLEPRILRLDPALALGYARDLDVLPNTIPPERHRGYALQWFALALLTFITALFLGFRRRKS